MAGNQANVEYFFRLLYECLHGACYGSMAGVASFFAHLWVWITIIGYIVAVLALFVIIYCMVRLFELRKREKEFYSTPLIAPDEEGGVHPRWNHIESLADGKNPSEWREAIIEADILLDELLTAQGYEGNSVAEKLNSAERTDFATLKQAWEAHKVRNQIAHQGSSFQIDQELMHRTLSHYEAVFREFKVI